VVTIRGGRGEYQRQLSHKVFPYEPSLLKGEGANTAAPTKAT